MTQEETENLVLTKQPYTCLKKFKLSLKTSSQRKFQVYMVSTGEF